MPYNTVGFFFISFPLFLCFTNPPMCVFILSPLGNTYCIYKATVRPIVSIVFNFHHVSFFSGGQKSFHSNLIWTIRHRVCACLCCSFVSFMLNIADVFFLFKNTFSLVHYIIRHRNCEDLTLQTFLTFMNDHHN